MNNIEFSYKGKRYNSCGSIPLITQNYFGLSSNYDDCEVKVAVYDDDGKRYIAEFVVPHKQVLMLCDQSDYVNFIIRKSIPIELLNESNLYDINPVQSRYFDEAIGCDFDELSEYSEENLLTELSISHL